MDSFSMNEKNPQSQPSSSSCYPLDDKRRPSRHSSPVRGLPPQPHPQQTAPSPQCATPNHHINQHSHSNAGSAPSPFYRIQPPSRSILSRPQIQLGSRPRELRFAYCLQSWLPLILYAATSLAFVFAIALYKEEVFSALDQLANWLRLDEQFGHAVLFFLIFLTTFPPIPLYSTLTVLSGYTFGAWTGAIISYFAALSGAICVFAISRTLLRGPISRWLASTITIKRVVRAIEKRPKLLFLIRLAPYPYNVMNCLLAASPTLTFRTYTICTALSLFKVIIHTSLGASIHSFRDYHVTPTKGDNNGTMIDEEDEEETSATVARLWTIIGVGLCVLILIYLSVVARRAVDEELEDEETGTREETHAFLSPVDLEEGYPGEEAMAESPFRVHDLVQPRQ